MRQTFLNAVVLQARACTENSPIRAHRLSVCGTGDRKPWTSKAQDRGSSSRSGSGISSTPGCGFMTGKAASACRSIPPRTSFRRTAGPWVLHGGQRLRAATPDDREQRDTHVGRLWPHRKGPPARRISRAPPRAGGDARLLPMPAACVAGLSDFPCDDIYGRIVAYERLLLPFWDGSAVNHVIASLKTISQDGGFEISNLMRGSATLPRPILRAVIDRDLFHRTVGHLSGDVLEFN